MCEKTIYINIYVYLLSDIIRYNTLLCDFQDDKYIFCNFNDVSIKLS